ncbi:hypothetical protein BDDG_09644, partial [Blastomyces dermatitidis ATCC 18188]
KTQFTDYICSFRHFEQNNDCCLYHISVFKQIETTKSSVSTAEMTVILTSALIISKLLIQCTIEEGRLLMSAAECYICRGLYYINCCLKKEKNSDYSVNQVKMKNTEKDDNELLNLDLSLDSDIIISQDDLSVCMNTDMSISLINIIIANLFFLH